MPLLLRTFISLYLTPFSYPGMRGFVLDLLPHYQQSLMRPTWYFTNKPCPLYYFVD